MVTGILFPESVDLEDFSSVDIMFVWRASENWSLFLRIPSRFPSCIFTSTMIDDLGLIIISGNNPMKMPLKDELSSQYLFPTATSKQVFQLNWEVDYSIRWSIDAIDTQPTILGNNRPSGKFSDFEEYMCSAGFMEGSTKYQLYGVINHHGNVGGGHYTANAVSWHGFWCRPVSTDACLYDKTRLDAKDVLENLWSLKSRSAATAHVEMIDTKFNRKSPEGLVSHARKCAREMSFARSMSLLRFSTPTKRRKDPDYIVARHLDGVICRRCKGPVLCKWTYTHFKDEFSMWQTLLRYLPLQKHHI